MNARPSNFCAVVDLGRFWLAVILLNAAENTGTGFVSSACAVSSSVSVACAADVGERGGEGEPLAVVAVGEG